jgi:hypothetical protein
LDVADRPPAKAAWNSAAAELALLSAWAATLRRRCVSRCEYSSNRNSSVQPHVTWLSEPMDHRPPSLA